MTTVRRQAAKLGIFVIGVIAVLLVSLLTIGGLRFWRPVDEYYVVTPEGVAGLDVNSSVLLRGVAIGKVSAIALDRSTYAQVTIELAIDPSIAIPVGSKAYFERIGLTGERVINISGGSLAEGRLAPGTTLPRGETDIERLQARVEQLGDDVTTLITDLTETLHDVEALVAAVDPERVRKIVEAVEPERLASIVEHTERAAKTLAATSNKLERAVGEARSDIDEVASKAASALERADAAAAMLLVTLDEADTILKSNAADVRMAVHNLRLASEDAKALIERLRERPSLLLRSPRERERERKRKRR